MTLLASVVGRAVELRTTIMVGTITRCADCCVAPCAGAA